MWRRALVSGALVLTVALAGCRVAVDVSSAVTAERGGRWMRYVDAARLPNAWRTRAERTEYQQTGRYDEVVDFCRRLAAASPHASYTTFGVSAEGRELPLLILSRERAFKPKGALRSDRLRVLIQNCIHPGECAGKDASLSLARDILITGARRDLLEHVNLLIMPIFNVDGHERFGPYSRINQLGPREAGWRVTATNLNLNRDYMKADAVEMRHWLRLWCSWQPDLFVDTHTTNGSDHQYELLYAVPIGQQLDPGVADWLESRLLPPVLAALEEDGRLVFPYAEPRDHRDLSRGIEAAVDFGPRYSTGYVALWNRPGILLEAHARKPYARRVGATYAFLVHMLEVVNRESGALRSALRAADQRCRVRRGAADDGRVVLEQVASAESEPITYLGLAARSRHSPITGDEVLEYTGVPIEVPTRLYNRAQVIRAVSPPAAYLVPSGWTGVVERLSLHGIEFFRLARPARLSVEMYRFTNVEFPRRPYEGRFRPSYAVEVESQTREWPAGTVVVPLHQPRAKLVAHLLEPEAPDSLVAWGLLNAIFERKEYAESYVLEPLAQEMLAADPQLRAEFEQKLRTDEDFAGSPAARLDFFYQRSPYWDTTLNLYPIARLMDGELLERLSGQATR